jgi:3-oxoacyl-(acyl-carrier-protein) synthase
MNFIGRSEKILASTASVDFLYHFNLAMVLMTRESKSDIASRPDDNEGQGMMTGDKGGRVTAGVCVTVITN